MPNDPSDLNTLPSGIDVQSIVDSATSQQPAPDAQQEDSTGGTALQTISYPFCLQFNGQPWQTITVAAPSPETAALTVSQVVQLINETLVGMGYPPNLCTAASGSC